ncbi:putative transcriptional regulatory protein-like protein [Dinothrombium tinctorium]|uniref:Putative transcriptional regulatory protein-like protein n=1 Tax=Dinothrombium tinctorium TaxID=1965070 RepID=A0A443QCI4_9ACAR|nr:putative transcriptional regulatory protein-like protein [Dinothrombium tinctorium]
MCTATDHTQLRFAGHAKWQNIKHIKAKNDAIKAKVFSAYALKLRRAASEGGPDPSVNSKLAALIVEAKAKNVTGEVIDRALKAVQNAKLQQLFLEVQGPAGVLFLLHCETENVGNFRYALKKSCRKFNGGILREGAARFHFEEKGVIKISKTDNDGKNPLTFEKAEELAIEAGAEEVVNENDGNKSQEDSDDCWTFKTAPEDIYSVKQYLEKNAPQYQIKEYDVQYIPLRYAQVNDKEVDQVYEFINALDENEEVTKFYHNMKE